MSKGVDLNEGGNGGILYHVLFIYFRKDIHS